MSDQYLWDRSGPPDPDVERLERLLGRLQTTPPMPAWRRAAEAAAPGTAWRAAPLGTEWRALPFLAAAAALVVACGASLWLTRQSGDALSWSASWSASWSVVRVAGRPVVGASGLSGAGRLAVGEWLQTDGQSRASVAIADIGRLDVEPDTRLRLIASRAGSHRLALEHGTVHAAIWAPPGQFVVDTPASTAVDLGCAYTLSVSSDGAGTIDVEIGWVGFEYAGREAFIPAGARCATRPRVGPGTPYYADLDEQARQALTTLDFGVPGEVDRRQALATVIASARPRDAMTLWHLLSRVPPEDRDVVFDALARLVPPPASVTREGIRAGNRAMRDRWWDALDLGTSSWWRMWERSWRE